MKKVTSASTKMVVKDEWVAKAMTDDEMVVELLLRLKHAGTVSAENPAVNLLPLRWGIRQRRSRSSRFGVGGNLAPMKKDVDSVRASPKTPFSWSGGSGSRGGSASPSADGFEDTSRQASCSTSTGSGSKVFLTNEITSSFSKELRKKRSSSELRDEEKLKLKERLHLEKEIASLRATFDEQNVRNQRLKRIKIELGSGRMRNETRAGDHIHKSQLQSKYSKTRDSGSFFVVPDLNMMAPTEDEILYGTS